MADAQRVSDADDGDVCRVAMDAALARAFDVCDPEDMKRQQVSRLFGMGEEPDPDCEAALEEGLNAETILDTKGHRQWVMCRAWQLTQEEGLRLDEAMDRAWNEADEYEVK